MEAKQFKRILEMRLNANFEQDQFSTRLKYCIFRKNRALAPHERSAVPLGTDHCPVG
ncbi:hypothetical protein ACTQ32_15130 [Roseburia faecis]|uniref:hypothetical protein n=1 Tax=Roseburia faecis TaxID=301302 RepID=UPI003F98EA96